VSALYADIVCRGVIESAPTQAKSLTLAASDVLRASDDAYVRTTSTVYTRVKGFTVPGHYAANNKLRAYFELRGESSNIMYGRIYVNGVAVGIERSTGSRDFVPYTEDIDVQPGDVIEVWCKSALIYESFRHDIQNFRLKGTETMHFGTLGEAWV
jgi:hypothetical protein